MTAELALALPAVVLVLAALLVTGQAASTQLRCQEGARAGARAAALGLDDAQVGEIARAVAGSVVALDVERTPPWVRVEVSGRSAGGWFSGGPLAVSASATGWAEP